MKEITLVMDLQVIYVIKDGKENEFDEEAKRSLSKLFKNQIGADDVSVRNVKQFVRDVE